MMMTPEEFNAAYIGTFDDMNQDSDVMKDGDRFFLKMDINEGLKQMWKSGVRRLDVYWLEENEEGHEHWWCDVINDDLNDLCKTSWIWTVMSRVEYENEERHDLTMEEEDDWLIIVDEEKFSDDLISDHIKRWSRDRGFEFEVKVIDSAGTKGEKQMLDAINGD